MSISLDEVRHVARLARLDLEEVEVLALQTELNALLGHFAELQDVDASDIQPQSHAVNLQNVWSEDRVAAGLSREAALANAHSSKAGLFLVPTIIED